MSEDLNPLSSEISDALKEFDYDRAHHLSTQLIKILQTQPVTQDAKKPITRVLQALRRMRTFKPMGEIAKTYLDKAGMEIPQIQLQLIQALIDQNILLESRNELHGMVDKHSIESFAGSEARGLIGRVNKQAYINAHQSKAAAKRSLEEAVRAYYQVYLADKSKYWWHGINAVACLARGERDGVDLSGSFDAEEGIPDWQQLAKEILSIVEGYDFDHPDYTWAMATATEACVALDRFEKAIILCQDYITSNNADVFELGSTERQLREVWQLDVRDVPCAQILKIIQGRLGQLGGRIENLTQVNTQQKKKEDIELQKQLGDEASIAVRWLDNLLKRAYSVVKIFKDTDDSVGGTGFLVKLGDMDGSSNEQIALLTNYHVVNEDGNDGAIPRVNAVVKLTRYDQNQEFHLGDLLWSCRELDAALYKFELPESLDNREKILGLPIGRKNDLLQQDKTPRMYVIGHPLGDSLQISLYDNRLIDMDQTYVRYRCPTESGSSGSPVLSGDLCVVAIHQATRPGQKANQGILLDCIREKIKSDGLKA
jgi:hypothetical protein